MTKEIVQTASIVEQLSKVPSTCLHEIEQTSNLSFNVVYKILKSKRLLIDHVELLENCLIELEPNISTSNIFTFKKASVIIANVCLANQFILNDMKLSRTAITTLAGGYGLLTLIKGAAKVRNKIVEKRVDRLIDSLDKYGSCIKRNTNYFNEIQFIKMNTDELEIDKFYNEKAWQCIKSIKEVTTICFDATRTLEENCNLSANLSDLYTSMEDLNDCDYFRRNVVNYSSRNIKDFYNIFAYVQSQFLLRLGLAAAENSSTIFLRKDITTITKFIEQQIFDEENRFKKLSAQLKSRKQADLSKIHEQGIHQTNFSPSAILKDTSLKLSSYLVVVTEEYQRLDEILQNIPDDFDDISKNITRRETTDKLLQAANMIQLIENSLSNCCDDFHRLILIYNKFMGNRFNAEFGLIPTESSSVGDDEILLAIHTSKDLNESEENESDDFYAYMFDEQVDENTQNNEENKLNSLDYELSNLDKRMTKKRFKPVLQQLRNKIDPIREEMLQKERKVLEAKGIDVEKFFDVNHKKDDEKSQSDTESECSADEIINNSRKHMKRDNFEENREFLAQKVPMNIFNKFPAQNPIVSEEILE